jgi:hypothetical protein
MPPHTCGYNAELYCCQLLRNLPAGEYRYKTPSKLIAKYRKPERSSHFYEEAISLPQVTFQLTGSKNIYETRVIRM